MHARAMNDKLGRREVLKRSLIVLAAAPILGACGSSGPDCSSTAGLDPTAIANRTTQQYVEHSVRASSHCSSCRFYTAGAAGGCGTCQLIAGPINPDGYCNLFSAAG
jgi:hypothetical protein